MCKETEKDCGEMPNFTRVVQDEVTPTGELEKVIRTLRDLFYEGKPDEGCRVSITFLSGMFVGLSLKEKENYEKFNLQ